MKEIEKEIKKEIIEHQKVYIALDGTEFLYAEECKKYEGTALCILKDKVKKLIVNNEYNELDLFGTGSDENQVIAIKMNTKEDASNVLQLYLLCYPYLCKDDDNPYRVNITSKIEKAFNEGDLLILGCNYDGDYYIIDTRNSIVEKLINLKIKKEDETNRN